MTIKTTPETVDVYRSSSESLACIGPWQPPDVAGKVAYAYPDVILSATEEERS